MFEKESYHFDAASIDGSDADEEMTIDNWRPKVKKNELILSKWRQSQNGNNHNIQPGLDELKKIMMHLKKKHADSDIMKAFGITSETLVAIKRGCYSPIEGISLDNQSKIYEEFKKINKRLDIFNQVLSFLGDNVFENTGNRRQFRKLLGLDKKNKRAKKVDNDVNGSDEEE